MRIAALIKQIPAPEEFSLSGGRLVRDGVSLEVNAYCRRANAKAVELAGCSGEVVVFTMGPAAAEDALREMIACGASRGVHLCDPAFAGADTLATARALAAAIKAEGDFDLVLAGLNSLDADTGQVGPEVAEILGMPFAGGVRELEVEAGWFRARLEADDGYSSIEGALPAVLSVAERLCDPSKAGPDARSAVSPERITTVGPVGLGLTLDECGVAGSPTIVGPAKATNMARSGRRAATGSEAVHILAELGAFDDEATVTLEEVPATGGSGPAVWCFIEPGARDGFELLGEAAALAASVGGSVTAIVPEQAPVELGSRGADRVLVIPNAPDPEQWGHSLADAAAAATPYALLVEGTRTGRAIASTVAARNGWGLTGDAIGLEIAPSGRLVGWKPAFGGRLIAPIESRSCVQVVTIRPGVLARRTPRRPSVPAIEVLPEPRPSRVRVTAFEPGDDAATYLGRARSVIGVGTGVAPGDYHLLKPLIDVLGGAPLAATRKVTDRAWMPRSRQVGVTGHSIAPRLYVGLGMSGRFNHFVGVSRAGFVLAVNNDPKAEIFEHADVGLIADWRDAVPTLTAALSDYNLGPAVS